MSYMEWENAYSVGVQEIDLQHKKLFTMINNLFDALKESRGNDIVGKIIKDFVNYASEHFALEEGYMKRYDFPDYHEHKKVHDDCVKKITDLLKTHEAGKVHLSIVTFNFLKDWLANHVLGMDKKYTSFFHSKGLS